MREMVNEGRRSPGSTAAGLGDVFRLNCAPTNGAVTRLRELQVGSPVKLELALVASYQERQDACAVADELCRQFAPRRAHGSWYRVTAAEVGRALASRTLHDAPAQAAAARAAAAAPDGEGARLPAPPPARAGCQAEAGREAARSE